MAVILIVSLEVARALHAGDAGSPVARVVADAGGTLHPMPAFDPGEPGERTFTVGIAGDAGAALCTRLRALPGIEACYVKPDNSLP